MDHEADVRAIDTHPERNGRHHDVDLLVQEGFLVPGTDVVRQASMIGNRSQSLAGQPVRRLLHLAARQAVDDARLVLVPGQDAKNLAALIGTAQHPERQVRTIERADQHERIAKPQLRDDVSADALGGGGGEGVHRDAGEFVAQAARAGGSQAGSRDPTD